MSGETRACALCGHDPACGMASATREGEHVHLCHADEHSCYQCWTVYGERPERLAGTAILEED